MFRLSEPSQSDVIKFLSRQAELPFSYEAVGATATNDGAPHGFNLDHNRIQLGRGEQIYRRGVVALKAWRQFELGWVSLVAPEAKIEAGVTVAVKAWACGMWSLNACRVVYVVDETDRRFAFAYGTLADH